MVHRVIRLIFAVALSSPALALAQGPDAPPPVLQIGREVVKPGKAPAHYKMEAAWSRALEASKYPGAFFAMSATTGPAEVWFLSGFESWDALQKAGAAADAMPAVAAVGAQYAPQEAELLSDIRGMVGTFRGELSYLTGGAMTTWRYMTVQRILVKAGSNDDFVAARKTVKAAHEQAKLSDGYAVYQIVDGAPAGTYYILAGRRSLKELDDGVTEHAGEAYVAALGGAEGQKKLAALAAGYQVSAETNVFAFSPDMSVVPKAWKDADPFWKPKPAAKKAP